MWEVTARNPEQKAPGSTSGLVSALIGADTQERPLITPWCPGTNTYPDLGIRALKSLILYIENPKDSTRKLLELINEYSKVAGYKIKTQKSLAFLYTNNEKTEREIKETIPFTIATKRIKYLGVYLPKETKVLYTETPCIPIY